MTGGPTILPGSHPDAPTSVLPVFPQEAPRRQRRWQSYSVLIGVGLGLLLLGPWLDLLGLL